MTTIATNATSGGLSGLPRRAEAWLDSKGRAAWIAAMVLGFMLFWPVGLALVAYITWTNRWSKDMFKFNGCTARKLSSHSRMNASTGNSAFDAYRAETIRRLEEEQDAFEAFLKRLRDAKDKQEFDAFMEDRARANASRADTENRTDIAAY